MTENSQLVCVELILGILGNKSENSAFFIDVYSHKITFSNYCAYSSTGEMPILLHKRGMCVKNS